VVTSPLIFLSAKHKSLFFFFVCRDYSGGFSFLNADRVKRKLPSLLVDDSTIKKKSWNSSCVTVIGLLSLRSGSLRNLTQ
jgi:hypothetical protein